MREVIEYQVGQSELGWLGFTSELPATPGQPQITAPGKKLWIQHRPVAGFSGIHLSAIDDACTKLQHTQDFEVAKAILQKAGIAVTYKKTP